MRNFLLAAVVALSAVASFTAPSHAGTDEYQPHCFVKKLLSYDYYGNPVIKRVRVCR